jgi:rhodanese-related sulfurtransferase
MLLLRRIVVPCCCALAVSTTTAKVFSTSAFTPPISHQSAARSNISLMPQRSLFSAFSGGDFATTEHIQSALENEKATILDVRGPNEIGSTGYWKTSINHAWVHMRCSPFDVSLLEQTAPSLLRDKAAPVVIHCASGKRVAKAKAVFDGLGYEQVLNVGGWNEVQQVIADIK